MNKLLTIIFLSSIYYLVSSIQVYAVDNPSFALAVSPSILRINATAPAPVEAEITIDNKNSQKEKLQIRIRNFLSNTSDGKINYIPEDKLELRDVLIRNKVRIIERDTEVSSIEIGPTDSKTLKLKIDVDSSIPHGDYYFSVLFISDHSSSNTNSASSSYTGGGIATNILLSIGPYGTTNGSISEFSTNFFLTQGPVQFTLMLQNSSDHYIVPSGNITITNMFGRDVGRVALLPNYILANSNRHSLLIWPEKLLFGLYRATAVVDLSDTGPIFKRSIIFVSLPVYALSSISLFIFILIGIYLRVKRKI